MAKQWLDVGAMYRIGSAGATVKNQTQRDPATGFISKIGNMALQMYIGAQANKAESLRQTNQQVEGLNDPELPNGLSSGIDGMKDELVNARNTMLDPVLKLFNVKSEKFQNAVETESKILNGIEKLKVTTENWATFMEQQEQMVHGNFFIDGKDGGSVQVGMSGGSTRLQQINSTILANRKNNGFNNAVSVGNDGVVMVDLTKIDLKNPNLSREDYYRMFDSLVNDKGELVGTKVTWENFQKETARPENPNNEDVTNDHINAITAEGNKGQFLSDATISDYRQKLVNSVKNKSSEDFTDHIFEDGLWTNYLEGGVIEVDDSRLGDNIVPGSVVTVGQTSVADQLIRNRIADILQNPDEFANDELYGDIKLDADGDGNIDIVDWNENYAAVEALLKEEIRSGEFDKNEYYDLVHNRAMDRYNTEYEDAKTREQEEYQWKLSQQKNTNKTTKSVTERREDGIYREVKRVFRANSPDSFTKPVISQFTLHGYGTLTVDPNDPWTWIYYDMEDGVSRKNKITYSELIGNLSKYTNKQKDFLPN